LTANAGYWRVRHDPSTSGAAARILTCYKDANLDPQRDALETTAQFRQSPFPRPEARLEGVMYQMGNAPDTDLPLLVADPTSWVMEGTASRTWERLANVLGPEWDQLVFANAPANLEIVLDSPAIRKLGGFSRSQATVYYPTDHSFVFAAGTIDFARALARPGSVDPRVQRMTENLLARAGMPPRVWTQPAPEPPEKPSASEVSVLAGTGVPGLVNGPPEVAQFNAPSGIALGADGALYVTEVGNHVVRRVAPDGSVTSYAGCGVGRFRDGVGVRACFDTPTAIVAAPDGFLFVSDTGNERIRTIGPGARVTTLAGDGKAGLLDSPNRRLARFQGPRGLALGSDGSLYVTEPHHGALRRLDPAGGVSTLLVDYIGVTGVAVGADDSVYLSNTTEGSVAKWLDGKVVVLANLEREPGDRSGTMGKARLRPGEGILLDGTRLLIPDMGNYRLRELDLSTREVTTLAGDGRAGDEASETQGVHMVLPRAVAKFRDGYAVADTGNHRILFVRR
jgi:DNA-binding beta-propeller fold protein YncE